MARKRPLTSSTARTERENGENAVLDATSRTSTVVFEIFVSARAVAVPVRVLMLNQSSYLNDVRAHLSASIFDAH